MATKEEKLKKALERDEAKIRELERKLKQRKAEYAAQERTADTRRKILAGSWALEAAASDSQFADRMMQALNHRWLIRDDDRIMFGLAVLTDEEKAKHPNINSIRRGKAKAAADAPKGGENV